MPDAFRWETRKYLVLTRYQRALIGCCTEPVECSVGTTAQKPIKLE